MSLVKHMLGKTGWFPKLAPRVEDVLKAADMVFEIKSIRNNRGKCYYYVVPESLAPAHLMELARLFRSNGIILRPHHSKNYNLFVLRVPNRNQKFIQDVIDVRADRTNFQYILKEYTYARMPKPKENSK